jgi:hypothetical protein
MNLQSPVKAPTEPAVVLIDEADESILIRVRSRSGVQRLTLGMVRAC